jgi:hypothetical protein
MSDCSPLRRQLYLHVSAGKVTPMDAGVRERLTRVQVARRSCPPAKSGRVERRPVADTP